VPAWTTFAGLTLVVLVALLVLARASQEYVPDDRDREHRPPERVGTGRSRGGNGNGDAPGDRPDRRGRPAAGSGVPDGATAPGNERERESEGGVGTVDAATAESDGAPEPERGRQSAVESRPDPEPAVEAAGSGHVEGTAQSRDPDRPRVSAADLPTGVLLANVTVSQATFGVVLLAGAWLARIPPTALGLPTAPEMPTGAVGLGIAVGAVLYVLNAAGAELASAGGVEYDETLRELMTPATIRGWIVLLGVVLPVVAGFEEFLFRAALIGVPAAGLELPAWPLAVVSSAAFAFGHGAQGRAGIAVTGVLGFGLAAAFVLTDSLVVVVVAHYLVNALEFVLGGHFGIDPFG